MNSRKRLNTRYAVIEALYFVTLCVVMSYTNVLLTSIDLSTAVTGMVLSAGSIISAFLQPAAAAYADRKHTPLRAVLTVMAAAVAAISAASVVFLGIPAVVAVCFALMIALVTAMMPFLNGLAFVFEKHGVTLNFSAARGTGSIAYAVFSLIFGFVVNAFSPKLIPLVPLLTMLGLIPLLRGFRLTEEEKRKAFSGAAEGQPAGGSPADAGNNGRKQSPDPGRAEALHSIGAQPVKPGRTDARNSGQGQPLGRQEAAAAESGARSLSAFVRRYTVYFFYLAGVILVYMNHQVINTFMLNLVENVGGTESDMGIALFFQSLLELPAMLLYQKFRDRVKTGSVLIFSGVMFSVRHICTAAASSLIPFFFIQLLQAGAFALFIPASVYFADEFFDSADAAKGQSLVTMCITIAGIIATFFGGFLLDGIGVHRTLVFFSAISVLGSLILVFAVRKMEKTLAGRKRAVS